uniref:RRM domain-containing protein n=1 Tax=Graphocephala atropunctata TaxID=36148 RepID=A0A1B6LC54_9HEMI
MSSSNWVRDREDMSPDRHNRYRLDNVGLQLGLGLPLQLLGVSVMADIPSFDGNRRSRHVVNSRNRTPQDINPLMVQQTIDGIPIRKLYITNISIEVRRFEMYHIFGQFGQIMNVFLGVSKNDNSKQFAFITFANPQDAAQVLARKVFCDSKGRRMYALAADSWHQPQEMSNGEIIWKTDRKNQARAEESEEEDDQTAETPEVLEGPVETPDESLNGLNDDCLLHIFSFLTYKEIAGVERVCKRWQALSYRMWRCLHKLNFTCPPFRRMEMTTPCLEQYLRRCGDCLTLLDLSINKHSFNEGTIIVVAKYCPNLEVLRITNIHLANRSLAHLGRRCPRLKEFVMDDCPKINDTDLMSMLPKCLELNYLELSHVNGITGKCLVNVQGPVTNLKLNNCPSIVTDYLVPGLEKMSKTLNSLTLSASGNLSSGAMEKIVTAVPNLTTLSMSRCSPQLENNSLSAISQLTKLTDLNLFLNNAVSDSFLTAIVEGCEHLTTLNLGGSGGGCTTLLSEDGLSVVSRIRELRDLDISYLEVANNVVLKSLALRGHRLRRLLCRGCPDLTDEGSSQVVSMCNDLELFDLSGCNNIGMETVEAARTSVKIRTNSVPLKLIVGGTNVESAPPDSEVPLLTVDLADLSEEHLRPDFIDDMFFPPTDSDSDEDLDHLCCDCDFDFDDLNDPTLFPCDFDDDSPKFGVLSDSEDTSNWFDKVDDDDEEDDEYFGDTWKN